MAKRSGVLELAVLGLLQESPMHGYELRKRLHAVLGPFRALSYGSLYPALRDLVTRGYITETPTEGAPLGGKRARIVYQLTADGKERLADLLGEAGPAAWEDENFGVHFALFAQTDSEVRLRILEGRRSRLEERLDTLRTTHASRRERLDAYTLELQRHGLEGVEREVRWLNELIADERLAGRPIPGSTTPGPTDAPQGQPRRDVPSAAEIKE